jgi:hypothetical protein
MYSKIPNSFNMFSTLDEIPVVCPNERKYKSTSSLKRENPNPPGSTGIADFEKEPGPPVKSSSYTQGWLTKQIGKYIKVEFLIGTNMIMDREGFLTEVGISYIVLKESGTNDELMCDMYSIKFVRIFDNQEKMLMCK